MKKKIRHNSDKVSLVVRGIVRTTTRIRKLAVQLVWGERDVIVVTILRFRTIEGKIVLQAVENSGLITAVY